MPRVPRLTSFVVALSLVFAVTAHADPVTHWNKITVDAVTAGRAGPPGLFDIALVQAAVHDAVQVIEGNFQPYHYSDASRRGVGSPAAAVAAASHRVLVLLYPGQQGALDTAYNAYLAANGLVGDAALQIGEDAAAALYANQYRPALAVTPFTGNTAIGQWRSAVPMGFQHMAISKPFTLNRIDQFRPPPPPPMTSTVYAREYDEAKALGRASAHPNANTDVARFWSGNFVFQWNETLREIVDAKSLSIGDGARVFALANLATSDAAMAVWESKIFYNFWRPITAIQEGDNDGINRTAGDPGWVPLIATPPYPDYVSGANGLTGAFTAAMRLYFGTDTMTFTVKNPSLLVIDKTRHYTTFSQAADEVVEARILLGIHFRSADAEGRRLGERVAHWTFQKYLKAVPGGHN